MNEKSLNIDRALRFSTRIARSSGTFVIANCWDGGSAKILTSLGFPALGHLERRIAGTLGRLDPGSVHRRVDGTVEVICAATSLPVSADLEKGFGDAPADTAKAVRLAAGAGLVGGSIEDATGRKDAPLFDVGFATERVAAAAAAARALPFPFTLTARAENYLHGRPDLDDTIVRLQAYEKAAPMCCLPLACPIWPPFDRVRLVTKPLNFMVEFAASRSRWRARRRRRTTHQPRHFVVPRGHDRAGRGGARDPRVRHVWLSDDSMSSADFARYLKGGQ